MALSLWWPYPERAKKAPIGGAWLGSPADKVGGELFRVEVAEMKEGWVWATWARNIDTRGASREATNVRRSGQILPPANLL